MNIIHRDSDPQQSPCHVHRSSGLVREDTHPSPHERQTFIGLGLMRKILAIYYSCRGFLHGIHIREPNHFSSVAILVIEITGFVARRLHTSRWLPPRFAPVIPMTSFRLYFDSFHECFLLTQDLGLF